MKAKIGYAVDGVFVFFMNLRNLEVMHEAAVNTGYLGMCDETVGSLVSVQRALEGAMVLGRSLTQQLDGGGSCG